MSGPADERLHLFVEAFALQTESSGWPRIAGRILGWLLVSPEPEQSSEQLAAALGVSKASISTMTRFLLDRGFIEPHGRRADRRTYFRIVPGLWAKLLRDRLAGVEPFRRLAEEAAELLAGTDPAASGRVHEMAEFYRWWALEAPGLWDRWEDYWRTRRNR